MINNSPVKHLQKPLKPLLSVLLMAYFPLAAYAAGPVIPGAGNLLQQVQPVVPSEPSTTGLAIAPKTGATLALSAPFLVKTIAISGNTLFPAEALHALVASAEGTTLTLNELSQVAARITDYYHRHGYPLVQTLIPAQKLSGGTVTIEVLEARYGKISLNNHSRVRSSLLEKTLSPLKAGQEIEQADLDHALLLLSDISGMTSSATLAPGENVGTSDLIINAASAPMVSGYAVGDDAGNRYTGRARLGATVNVNNPLHMGDVLSANVLSSGSKMNYANLSYETLLNGHGTRIGGSFSSLYYKLGESLASLNAHGTAQVGSLWLKQPLIRSRNLNLSWQFQHDQLTLRDHIDASNTLTDRHVENWTLGLNGDLRDSLLAGAVSSWNMGWTSGHVGFNNDFAQLADNVTSKTQGSFSKFNVSFSRLQGLSQNNALSLSFTGQWANTNLDAAEKMSVGGIYSVRAYDMGALSGDTGYQGTAELRHEFGTLWSGHWQAVAFVDSAHLTINKNVWVAGQKSANLSGAGVGLNWTGPAQWAAKALVAAPLGATSPLVGSSSPTRIWVEIAKGF